VGSLRFFARSGQTAHEPEGVNRKTFSSPTARTDANGRTWVEAARINPVRVYGMFMQMTDRYGRALGVIALAAPASARFSYGRGWPSLGGPQSAVVLNGAGSSHSNEKEDAEPGHENHADHPLRTAVGLQFWILVRHSSPMRQTERRAPRPANLPGQGNAGTETCTHPTDVPVRCSSVPRRELQKKKDGGPGRGSNLPTWRLRVARSTAELPVHWRPRSGLEPEVSVGCNHLRRRSATRPYIPIAAAALKPCKICR
jgi:hypothetical protein